MALPTEVMNEKLISHVQEMTGVLNRLLLRTDDIQNTVNNELVALRVRQGEQLGDLVAAAEIYVDEAAAPMAEREDDENLLPLVTRLTAIENVINAIKEPIEQTAEATRILAAGQKEQSEKVLKDSTTDSKGANDNESIFSDKTRKKIEETAKTGILGFLLFIPVLLRTYFRVWFKTLRLVFGGFLTRIGGFFTGIFKKMKGAKGFGVISAGFAKISGFFKSIGTRITKAMPFLAKIGKFLGNAIKVIKAILTPLARIVAFLNPIGLAVIAVLGIVETIKGAIEGFKNQEGSFVDKVIAGLLGAMEALIDFLIFEPLNILKDLVAWMGGLLGFESFEETLNSMDFGIGGLLLGIKGLGISIVNWFLDTLAKLEVGGFTIPVPFGGESNDIKVPSFKPFTGLLDYKIDIPKPEPAEKVEQPEPTPVSDSQADSIGALKMSREDFVPVASQYFAEPVLVSKAPDKKGMYTLINPDGMSQKIEDTDGSLAAAVAAAEEGGFQVQEQTMVDGSPTGGDGVVEATQTTQDARDATSDGVGGVTLSTATGIDLSRKQKSESYTYYSAMPSSLNSRMSHHIPE